MSLGQGALGELALGEGSVASGGTPATAITLSGPSSGARDAASTNFTVGADGDITGTVIFTPTSSAGTGSFTPTTVSISAGTPTGTFTYTPTSVGARNINGTNNGGLTAPSNVVYTANALTPRVPTIGTATENGAHNGTVVITFTPNADNGGATVTAANATGSLGDNGSSGGSSPITVTIAAANKGVSQTWTVTQTNSAGASSPSGASNGVAATTLPGVPTSVVGTPGNTQVSVTGTAPADTGGLSLTYIGRFEGANATAAGARPRVVTGLTNGVAGTPELAAVNSLGTGAFGVGSDVTPAVTVPIMERTPFFSTDTPVLSFDVFQVTAGALAQIGSAHTAEFTDGGDTNITNALDVDLSIAPNGAYGDFYGFGRFEINSGQYVAIPLYYPPTSTPVVVKSPEVSKFLFADVIGAAVAQSLTLSASTVGTGRTATAGGGTPFAGTSADVGKYITEPGGIGRAIITAHSSTTVCTVTVIDAFSGTSISSGDWAFGQPGYKIRFFGADYGARITSGIIAFPLCKNQFAVLLELDPASELQYKLLWDAGN